MEVVQTITGRCSMCHAAEPVWEHVATRAYYLHLDEGGDALDNWLRAERELLAA